jgi:anti-anti-sigma regulatory factor
MSIPRPLPPEDDLFGRVAVHNKLVTREQLDDCVQAIIDEVLADRPPPSLASVLIEKGLLNTYAAAAVQKVVDEYAAKRFGTFSAAPGHPPQPKPMTSPAPAGESQVFVKVEVPEAEDKRFRLTDRETENVAVLTVMAARLGPKDLSALQAYCRRLLKTGRAELQADLRRVDVVNSASIAALVKTAADATAAGGRLVVLCKPEAAGITRMVFRGQVEVRGSELPPEPPPGLEPEKKVKPAKLSPDENFFARVAVHNKLAKKEQIAECALAIGEELAAGRPRPSLSAVMLELGIISSAAAAAIQKAVNDYAAKHAGTQPAPSGAAPRPKPMKRRPSAGESQMFVAIKPKEGEEEDERFKIMASKTTRSATLTVDSAVLAARDVPALQKACDRLVDTKMKEILVDVRRVTNLPTAVVSGFGTIAAKVKEAGSHMVLYCTEQTAEAVRMVHGKSLDIKVGKPPKGPAVQVRKV